MSAASREGTIELSQRIYNNRFMAQGDSFVKLLILIGIILFSGFAHAGAEIRQLRLSMNGDMTRLVIDVSGATGFSAQLYENPDRVELSIPGGQWAPPGFTPGDKSVIREFEANGENITLHLRRQATVANMLSLAPDGDRGYRLVLDLKPATPAQFAMKLGEVSTLGAQPRTLDQQAAQKAKASVTGFLRDKTETRIETKTAGKPSATPVAKKDTVKPSGPVKKPLVVIDAGHGGQDPGAIGRNSAREKDITLGVARALRDTLVASNKYRVVMTRDSDVFLQLADRVKVGQRNKADLFISLHADTVGESSDPELTRGASIYTISDTASDQVSARLAARENKADLLGGKKPTTAVGTILLDLMNHETMMRSKDFALAISQGFRQNEVVMLQRPLRSAGFAVLKGAEFPSVLIEMGFLSSNKDGNLLQQKDYQQKLARAMMAGVDEFFANDKLASLSE